MVHRIDFESTAVINLKLPATEGWIIGRSGNKGEYQPSIDLARYGPARARGVSRRHAVFLGRGDELFLVDLASINGTYCNGERLEPHTPRALRTGDELLIGEMRLRVL